MDSEGNKLDQNFSPEDSPSPLFQASFQSSSRDAVPLTKQPTSGASYPVLGSSEGGIAPGLEYMSMIDQLLVHQKVEVWEVLTGCETKNKYTIKNSLGQTVYTAKEDTDCCNRFCCGRLRPFDLRIKDNTGREVINLYRDLRCDSCCCPCCLQTLDVMSPPDILIGRVLQEWSILRPKYRVENLAGETVMHITGPLCPFSCFGDVVFPVMSAAHVEVGRITKQWSGLARELFTDADHFGITFPMDLDVRTKALMLGALFLIDFNYFERQN